MAARPAAIMAPMKKTSMVLAAAAVAAAAPSSASAATTLVPSLSAPTNVAAYAGTVMWSERDAVTGGFRLMKSVDGGTPVAVPVAERTDGAFDLDLGTNRSGALYAVYSRKGDLYRMRVATGEETKLTTLSDPIADERDPSIQRGRIAFVRRVKGRDQIRIGDTTSGAKGTRLVRSAAVVRSVELGIQHLAYVVGVPSAEFGQSKVHIRNIRTGRDSTVYVATSGGANAANVTKPSFKDDLSGFVWARTNNGSGAGNRIVQYTLRGSQLSFAQGSPRYATGGWAGEKLGFAASTALDAGSNSACEDGGKTYCSVLLTGPLVWAVAQA